MAYSNPMIANAMQLNVARMKRKQKQKQKVSVNSCTSKNNDFVNSVDSFSTDEMNCNDTMKSSFYDDIYCGKYKTICLKQNKKSLFPSLEHEVVFHLCIIALYSLILYKAL